MSEPRPTTLPSRPPRPAARVYTVSQVTAQARAVLEGRFGRVRIQGEVSNYRAHGSGHWYFSLKDADARVRCVMFASRNRFVRFRLRDGDAVVVAGRLSIYDGNGDFQAVVDSIEPAGEGALRAAFDALKAKLEAEGLFAAARKRALPRYPRHIAVISSRAGAALRDVLSVLRRRFPSVRVTCFDVAVQGFEAPGQIASALDRAEGMRGPPDVIVVTRGGGSLEDLAAFNTAPVVRRIAACRIPVVSAVGHETDVTLADFAADQRAPTPSAAAEMITPDTAELLAGVARLRTTLAARLATRLRTDQRLLDAAARRLVHPGRALEQRMLRADELETRLAAALGSRLLRLRTALAHQGRLLARVSPATGVATRRERVRGLRSQLAGATTLRVERAKATLDPLARALDAVSPLATLTRGFAIVAKPDGSRWGRPLASVADTSAGDRIVAHLADGQLQARVEHASPADDAPRETVAAQGQDPTLGTDGEGSPSTSGMVNKGAHNA